MRRFFIAELRDAQVVKRNIKRNVGAEFNQFFRKQCAFFSAAYFISDRTGQLFGVCKNPVEAAVFTEQLLRRFRPDARNAGNIVGRIAGQRKHVEHEVRHYAPFFLNAFGIDRFPAARLVAFHHKRAVPDKLH